MIQMVDPEGTIVPDADPSGLEAKDLRRLYRVMVLNRQLDERMFTLHRQGRIGFYVGSTGEEAAIIGSAFALSEDDWVVPCYREIGAALLRGYSLEDFICQILGNNRDPIKGRQMPCHWGSSQLRLLSVSSTVGSQLPPAVGLAHAAKICGKKDVVLTYFGDGATSEGDFHVALNFAGVYKIPVIFLCRNNQWAISVPLAKQTASENIAVKADAYGLEGVQVDGNDVLAMYSVTARAAKKAREGGGATLIEALTYRLGAHTTSDDPRAYRDDGEVKEWEKRDPIKRFRSFLLRGGYMTEEEDQELETEMRTQIQTTLKQVEKIGPPPIETMIEDVFETVPWHLQEQLELLD
jgi:2-oxoisovalerate dehydrogenase E1 component alpha subunit